MLSQLIYSFLEYLKLIKKYSPNTVLSYTNDLKSFNDFLTCQYEIDHIEQVSHHIIRSWVVELNSIGIESRSISRKLSCLRSFYKYLIKDKLVEINPMQKVISPKIPKKLPAFIKEKQIQQIIDYTDDTQVDDNFLHYRDNLIITLFYVTGMRRAELLSLEPQSIDVFRSEIKVLGKGKKERIIPVSVDVLEALKIYLQKRAEHYEKVEEDYLFLSNTGKKMNPRNLYNIVNTKLKEIDTSISHGPHILRHSFATHMLNNGADINVIKDIMGHANLSATQVYTHSSIKRLQEVYERSHPKA
jgi:integrase/recombinase XerC